LAGPELSQRALELFEEALAEPEETRADWLTRATANDPALRAKVESLIAADQRGDSLLPTGGALAAAPIAPPERVGHYRIVHSLGSGGMGETFLAARDDGLFDHEVAIKFMRPSRMAATARALFDRERRALAKLSHRHIAQLFDGGVADYGAPYLVMEYVRGAPIDEFAQGADVRTIARLIADVCDAVQYAHQNLIVHADLKPSNVLVNEAGDVKVIDFGVARLLGEGESETAHPFTVDYASPERQRGAAPTPADDVYALGALLRALAGVALTGDLAAIADRATAVEPETRYAAVAALRQDIIAWLETRPIAARSRERGYVLRKFVERRKWAVSAAVAALFAILGALAVTTYLYVETDRARVLAEQRFADVRGLSRYLLFDVYERLERSPRSLQMRRDVAREAQTYLEELSRAPNAPLDVRIETIEGLLRVAELQGGATRSNLGEFEQAKASLERASELAAALPARADVTTLRVRIAIAQAGIAMDVDQDLARAAALLAQARALSVETQPDSDLRAALAVEDAALANWQGRYPDAIAAAQSAVESGEGATRARQVLALRARDALAEAYYYQNDLARAETEYRIAARDAAAFAAADANDMSALRYAVRARWALATTLLQRGRAREALAELNVAAEPIPRLLAFEPADEASRRLDRIVLTARAQALAMSGNLEEGVRLLRTQIASREALHRGSPQVADYARAYAISLAMLADLYADNRRSREACPLYAQSRALFENLASRGVLSEQDRASALRMVLERQAQTCG
jgi:serine/threonine-protein kinase